MKALVPEKYKELVYKDVPDPVIKSNEVLIRVIACCLVWQTLQKGRESE